MIRIIVKTDSAGMACNIGGSVHQEFRTFDIEAPEFDKFMQEKLDGLSQRFIIGAEVVR